VTAIAALPGGGVPTWPFGAPLLVLTGAGRRCVAGPTSGFAKGLAAGWFPVFLGSAICGARRATIRPGAGWFAGFMTPSGWFVTKIGTLMKYRRGRKGGFFGCALRLGLAWLASLCVDRLGPGGVGPGGLGPWWFAI